MKLLRKENEDSPIFVAFNFVLCYNNLVIYQNYRAYAATKKYSAQGPFLFCILRLIMLQFAWAVDGEGVTTLPGGIHMILYQYMDLQYLSSCFENGVYASRLEKVNDPYEGLGIEYPNQYRICCMTKSPLKMLMWAYYVSHRGCCIGFDVGSHFQRVQYTDALQPHEEMNSAEIILSLYKKGREWKHEEEYRAVYYEPEGDIDLWNVIDDEVYFKAPVVSVTFGLTVETNPGYLEALEYLRDSGKSNVEYSKCKPKKGQYQLYKDKQFNIDQEIKKWTGTFSSHRYKLDNAEKEKLDFYLAKFIDEHKYNGEYNIKEEDNEQGGKTVYIGSIGAHIVRIKRRIEETIINTSRAMTNEDRKRLAIEPWHKFKCNNVILKDESVENPDFGNGLIKREPFNIYDEGILVWNPECERKIKVKLGNGTVIITNVYVVDELPFRNITEFDENGSVNYPYPTFYCNFKNGSPFAGKQYVDKQTAMNYKESQFVE